MKKSISSLLRVNQRLRPEIFNYPKSTLMNIPTAQEILSEANRKAQLTSLGTSINIDQWNNWNEVSKEETKRPLNFSFNLTPQWQPINNYSQSNLTTEETNEISDNNSNHCLKEENLIKPTNFKSFLLNEYKLSILTLIIAFSAFLIGIINIFQTKHSRKDCRKQLFPKK